MVKDIQQASRQLNKRQMTWFRDDPMYHWLDGTQDVGALVEQVVSSLQQAQHVGKSCAATFAVTLAITNSVTITVAASNAVPNMS